MLEHITSPKRRLSRNKLRQKRSEKNTPSPSIMNLDKETAPKGQELQSLQQTIDLKQCFQIEYAVYFNHGTTLNFQRSHVEPGFCDDRLVPLTVGGKRGGYSSGAWISSSSSAVSLFIFSYTPDSPLVLLISLDLKIHEEHFISKLHLSWPQTSCATLRGSRVVLASYKNSVGQIQKFAMRFFNSSQSQSFIDLLKESMEDVENIGAPSSNYLFEVPCENEFIHSDEVRNSVAAESDAPYPSNDNPLVPPLGHYGVEGSFLGETSAPHEESADINLPASNSAFLTNGSADDHEGATETVKFSMEADLFSHLAKNLPGTSFSAMLSVLEKFICNLEGDLTIKV